MSNKNTNLITIYSLGIIGFLALGTLAFTPLSASALTSPEGTYTGYSKPSKTTTRTNVVYVEQVAPVNGPGTYHGYTDAVAQRDINTSYADTNNTGSSAQSGLEPVIYSLSPDQTETGSAPITVSINGANFTKDSVVKWNSDTRDTIYINSNNLAVKLSAEDLSGSGEYLITVKNSNVYSNAVVFTLGSAGIIKDKEESSNDSNLAGSAILAGFLPSGILSWLIFGILILVAVILWRKVYLSGKDKQAPLKHA